MVKIRKQLTILCLVLALTGQGLYIPFAYASGNSDNCSVVAKTISDNTLPDSITNLVSQTNFVTAFPGDTGAGRIRLTWTAPADEPNGDKVNSYIIKYATFSISNLSGDINAWWNNTSVMQLTCLQLPPHWGVPENQSPGSTELLVISNLTPGQYYWFGIESIDKSFNHSFIDNQAQGVITQANAYASTSITPPGSINNLSALATGISGELILKWTASGNDGNQNTIIDGKYRIMYSTVALQTGIDPYNPVWAGANSIYISTSNINPGDTQSVYLEGLALQSTNYYFLVWTADEWYLMNKSTWNWSGASNLAFAMPYYNLPPSPVKSLTATPNGSNDPVFGSYVSLTWINQNPPEPDLKEIRIYSSTTAYPVVMDTFTYTALTPSNTQWSFYTLIPRTTYYYTVVVVDQANQLSTPVNCYAFTSIDRIAPDPVANLTALADANKAKGTYIELNWIDPDPLRTKYQNIDWSNIEIFISTDPVKGYVKDGGLPYNNQPPVILPVSTTWYEFTQLEPQDTYYIEVRSYDPASNFSVSTTSVYAWKDIIPPGPFKLLVTTPSYSDDLNIGCKIDIGWKYPDDNDLARIYVTYLDSKYPSNETEGTPIMHNIVRNPSNIDDAVSYDELIGNSTYYITLFLYDKSGNMSSTTVMAMVNVPKDNTAPFVPLGITSSKNNNMFTVTWDSVTNQNLVADITALSAMTKPVPKSTELYRYQIYESDNMTDWVLVLSTKPTETNRTFTCQVSTSGNIQYYKVRAIDICGNYNDSMVVDNSNNLNMYSLYTDDSYVKMDKNINSVVKNIYFNWTRNDQEEKGPVLRSYVIEPNVISNGQLLTVKDTFKFDGPEAEIAIKYDAQTVAALGSKDPAKWLSIFFYNGIEWLKLTSTVDTSNQYVKSDVKYIGKYEIRYVLNPTEFSYYKVMPKIITPNNDGKNDKAFFRFENPKQTELKIKIFNMTGTMVKDFGKISVKDSMNNGNMTYWDGTDTQGKLVAPGTYIYQIEGEGKVFNGTIIVAR